LILAMAMALAVSGSALPAGADVKGAKFPSPRKARPHRTRRNAVRFLARQRIPIRSAAGILSGPPLNFFPNCRRFYFAPNCARLIS
jgi:hypothetical protein